MLDTSAWKQADLDVLHGVFLDPHNVRLDSPNVQVETDMIEDLFVNEDALSLVEGIAKVGYLTHETPVVVVRDGKHIMVEGNRRLSALKAIQNPLLVPAYSSRISALASQIPNRAALATIHVMVAPTQSEADQLIAAIHTSNLRKAWTPARQAAFFQAQIDSGRKYADLLVRYPTIDVPKYVFRSHMVNLFKNAKISDPELTDFLASKAWSRGLSTLARIYESKTFLDLTGLKMDDKGKLSKSISDVTWSEMATEILRGMQQGNINTRTLNNTSSPRYTQLMGTLSEIKAQYETGGEPGPDPTPGGKGKSPDDGPKKSGGPKKGGSPQPQPGDATPKPKTAPKKAKVHYLALGDLTVPDAYPLAVRLHFEELSVTDVQVSPNSTFLMLRAILEKSVKSFADARNEDIRKVANNGKGFVQLGHALDWLLKYAKTDRPKMEQSINSVRGGPLVHFDVTKTALDAANHNHYFHVDSDQVINMFNAIHPVLKYVLTP